MAVHILKRCTDFCAHLINIFSFLRVLHLDIFPFEMRRGVVFPDHTHLLFLYFVTLHGFHSFTFKL